MWIHSAQVKGPRTLYPPTPKQFDELVALLVADGDKRPHCPLPIHGTPENRPRWDAYRAFAEFHIFRDRYERKLREPQLFEFSWGRPHVPKIPTDWPELDDEFLLEQELWTGVPTDPKDVTAALERLRRVTPTSPCWRRYNVG